MPARPSSQPAGRIADREVALVALQRGDQHLLRQAQEFRIETARDGHRPFHEAGHFVMAKRAGMKVVAVATTHPPEALGAADAVFENLAGLTVEKILRAVRLR